MKVEVPTRSVKVPDVIVLDGCALFWVVHWPEGGTLLDFVGLFAKKIVHYLQNDITTAVLKVAHVMKG